VLLIIYLSTLNTGWRMDVAVSECCWMWCIAKCRKCLQIMLNNLNIQVKRITRRALAFRTQ